MLLFSPLLTTLENATNIIISTHVNPDGDAIGSAMAMYYFLTEQGKTVRILLENKCPDNFMFLAKATQAIEMYLPARHDTAIQSADCAIVVDCGTLSRLKNIGDAIRQSKATKILIDHHINPEPIFEMIYSDASAIATGEIIYKLLVHANYPINKEIAEALFTSIYTDSGGFRFPNTSPQTFRIAGDLVQSGAEPHHIYEQIYNSNSLNKLQLQSLALASLETHFAGQLTIMSVTQSMFKSTRARSEDTEHLSQVPLSLAGSKVGIMLSEFPDNELRVSLRSKGPINVQQIATKFGGGGHINAAGCRLQGKTIEAAKQLFIKEVSAIVNSE